MANPITQVQVGGTTYDVKDAGAVRSINGQTPDASGNVEVQAGGGGGKVVFATIGTTWTENDDTGTKSQMVAIEGMTAENHAQVGPYYDSTNYSREEYVAQQTQYLDCITNGDAETVAGGIVFNIYGDANMVAIPIFVEVL